MGDKVDILPPDERKSFLRSKFSKVTKISG